MHVIHIALLMFGVNWRIISCVKEISFLLTSSIAVIMPILKVPAGQSFTFKDRRVQMFKANSI